MNPLPLVLETTTLPNELFSYRYKLMYDYRNYVIEIRNRFILSFLSWFCCLAINLNYQDNLIYILLKPCLQSYIKTPFYFVYNNLSEPLYTNIQTSINFSNQIFF